MCLNGGVIIFIYEWRLEYLFGLSFLILIHDVVGVYQPSLQGKKYMDTKFDAAVMVVRAVESILYK